MSKFGIEHCECGGDYGLFVWRADPYWWSCTACDGRVRPLTKAELREHPPPSGVSPGRREKT